MKKLLIIIMVVSLAGCSTAITKKQTGLGHPFDGIQYSSGTFHCTTVDMSGYAWPLLTVTIPMGFADMIFSGIADALLLPIDMRTETTSQRTINHCNDISSEEESFNLISPFKRYATYSKK